MERHSASLTTLGYALLGLIGLKPQTGYEIGKTFDETPMGTFSSSPGAIYPALKKLSMLGYINKAPREDDPVTSKSVYKITDQGRAALAEWVDKNITPDDVKRRMDELLLRFAYMEHFVTPSRMKRFIANLQKAIKAHVEWLEDYYETHEAPMTPLGRLALRNGIDAYVAQGHWADVAAREVEQLQKSKLKRSA